MTTLNGVTKKKAPQQSAAGAPPMAQSRAQASLVASAPEPRAAHARFG
jgi:hypothetical protein